MKIESVKENVANTPLNIFQKGYFAKNPTYSIPLFIELFKEKHNLITFHVFVTIN